MTIVTASQNMKLFIMSKYDIIHYVKYNIIYYEKI